MISLGVITLNIIVFVQISIIVAGVYWSVSHSSYCHDAKVKKGLQPEIIQKLCSKTPAPLKGLEGFFEVEEHEIRFQPWGFLGYNSSFALLGGKSILVDLRIRLLEL